MEEKEIESNKISIDTIIDTLNNKNEVIQKTKKSEEETTEQNNIKNETV